MDETKKGFMQNIGDLSFKKIDEANYEFSIKVEEKGYKQNRNNKILLIKILNIKNIK